MRRRAYDLATVWHLAAAPERCWAVLADPRMSWPAWWPGVESLGVRTAEGTGPVGSRARLRFRAPLGYALVLDLRVVDAHEPTRVRVAVTGDLHGTGDVRLSSPAPGSTRVDVAWRVRTTRRWMTLLAPVLAPVFVASHAATMRTGERGLRAHLARAATA